MRKLLPAVLLVMAASTAAGTSIGVENVTVDLRDSSVHVQMHVEELTSSSFSYITTYQVSDVEGWIAGKRTGCEVQDLQLGSEITCDTQQKSNFSVELQFESSGLVTERTGFSTFSYRHSVFRPTDRFNLKVILPAGKGILRPGNTTTSVVVPGEYSTGTVGGRNIYVKWSLKPQLGEMLSFQASYETLSRSKGYRGIIAGAVGAAILLILGYLGWIRYTRQPLESVYGEVDEDEKAVLELLKDNDSQMLQKDIVKQSDYSKAKISGLVKGLVEKGVLEKEKEGRSNRLKVAKKYQG
ncbi:MAG: helix-turn-helix transcriptional regulator [Candidatus Nanohaloarchaea archaeon]